MRASAEREDIVRGGGGGERVETHKDGGSLALRFSVGVAAAGRQHQFGEFGARASKRRGTGTARGRSNEETNQLGVAVNTHTHTHSHTFCSQMRAPSRFHEHEKLDRSLLPDSALNECFSRNQALCREGLTNSSTIRVPLNDLERIGTKSAVRT